MRISAWATVVAIGFTGSILAAGCVVGSDDEDDDAGPGTGGSSGSAGTGGRGGTGGTGGTAGTGGTGGTSGSAGTGGTGGGTVDCSPAAGDDACDTCMKTNCCAELLECATDAACQGDGELTCIQNCVLERVMDGGVANNETLGACANSCAEGSTVTGATNDAVACMANGERADGGMGTDCLVECLQGD